MSLNRLSTRKGVLAVATFAAVLIAGGWPSERVARWFSVGYSALANVALARMTFGHDGKAHLSPLEHVASRAGDPIESDTMLVLEVERPHRQARLGISLRRDAYLPLLIVVAVMAAGPLPWRRKLRFGGLGLLFELLVTLAAVLLLVSSILAAGVPGLYAPSTASLLDLASRSLLSPPGNRFMIPLGVGILLSWWGYARPSCLRR